MSDYVNVYLRVRPPIKSKNVENNFINRELSTVRMIVVDSLPYQFDRVFYKEDSQADVYHHMVEQKVKKVLEGFNCLIFAYGQSGAGKTHTIGLKEYPLGTSSESQGIIIRSIDSLFQKLADTHNSTISVSFVEIYKEKVYDLLTEKQDKPIYQKGTHYQGSFKKVIENSDEAREVILIGNRNRHTRGTLLNDSSSRSHALFTIEVRTESSSSIMYICDLAGSEGLRTTNHLGTPQKEGVEINKGLLALKRAIQELSKRKQVTSHRESVLTMILQSSLNLKSYFAMIGCITESREDRTETQSTIRFLQEIKKLDGKAVPELNALREKQRSNQTPMRPYMQPLSRNSSILNKTPSTAQNASRIVPKSVTYSSLLKKRPTFAGSIASRYQTPATKKARMTAIGSATTSTAMRPKKSVNVNETNQQNFENTFNLSNCSASTEIGTETESAQNSAQVSRRTSHSRELTNTSIALENRIKALENQLKFYQQAFQTSINFNHLQQTMMTSMTNNQSTEPDLNFTFDILEDGQANWQPRTWMMEPKNNPQMSKNSSVLPTASIRPTMNFSKLEMTNFDGGNRAMTSNQTTENRQVFTHLNNITNLVSPTSIPSKISRRTSTRIAGKIEKIEQKKFAEIERQKSLDFIEVLSTVDSVSKSQYKRNVLKIFNEGNINDLEKIPFIGKKTAAQIISLRTRKQFKDVEDLKKIYSLSSQKVWSKFLSSLFLD